MITHDNPPPTTGFLSTMDVVGTLNAKACIRLPPPFLPRPILAIDETCFLKGAGKKFPRKITPPMVLLPNMGKSESKRLGRNMGMLLSNSKPLLHLFLLITKPRLVKEEAIFGRTYTRENRLFLSKVNKPDGASLFSLPLCPFDLMATLLTLNNNGPTWAWTK